MRIVKKKQSSQSALELPAELLNRLERDALANEMSVNERLQEILLTYYESRNYSNISTIKFSPKIFRSQGDILNPDKLF